MNEITDNSLIHAAKVSTLCSGRTIELGKGNGFLSLLLAAGHINEAYGVDFDSEIVNCARKYAQNIGLPCKFAISESRSIPLPEHSFDTVILQKIDHVSRTTLIPHPQGQGGIYHGSQHHDDRRNILEAIRLCQLNGKIILTLDDNCDVSRLHTNLREILSERGIKFSIEDNDQIAVINLISYDENSERVESSLINSLFLAELPIEPLEMSELVSVIIPTFNRAHILRESLNSILGQIYKNIEVFVINDGSTDNTDEIIKPYLDKIKYFKKNNGGKSSAINFALNKVNGEYIWVFDDDDIAIPRKLEIQLRHFQRNKNLDLVFTPVFKFEGQISNIKMIWKTYPVKPWGPFFRSLLGNDIIPTPSVIVRKSCYDIIGGYREDSLRAQDMEMWIKIARKFKIDEIDYPTVFMRVHPGLRGPDKQRFKPTFEEIDLNSLESGRLFYPDIRRTLALEEIFPELNETPNNYELRLQAKIFRGVLSGCYLAENYALEDLSTALKEMKKLKISINDFICNALITIERRSRIKKYRKDYKRIRSQIRRTILSAKNARYLCEETAIRCYQRAKEKWWGGKYHQMLWWLTRFLIYKFLSMNIRLK